MKRMNVYSRPDNNVVPALTYECGQTLSYDSATDMRPMRPTFSYEKFPQSAKWPHPHQPSSCHPAQQRGQTLSYDSATDMRPIRVILATRNFPQLQKWPHSSYEVAASYAALQLRNATAVRPLGRPQAANPRTLDIPAPLSVLFSPNRLNEEANNPQEELPCR